MPAADGGGEFSTWGGRRLAMGWQIGRMLAGGFGALAGKSG